MPNNKVNTADFKLRPACGLALAVAYLAAGNQFDGELGRMTRDELVAEIRKSCLDLDLDPNRVGTWAKSLLISPEETLTEEQLAAVPRELYGPRAKIPDFTLRSYQVEGAAWAAHRMGSICAFGTGVGKTASSVAAAIAARRLGKCQGHRCFVICSANAVPTWDDYLLDLRAHYAEVAVISADNVHNLAGLDTSGGALIFDEVHKMRNFESNRSAWAHVLRTRFEWAVLLSATILESGVQALVSLNDLAVPGMSRVADKFDLAAMLNAVVVDKVPGRRGKVEERRRIVRPPADSKPLLLSYLARSTKSLTFDSIEVVQSDTIVPPQGLYIADQWGRPEWATPNLLWPPEMGEIEYLAAAMHAQRNENRQTLMRETQGQYATADEAEADVLAKLAKDPDNEILKQLRRYCGIPSLPALIWLARTEGRHDRCIERLEEGEPKRVTYRYVYAPGSTWETPKPGVKVTCVVQWIQAHPEESAVVGAIRTETINTVAKLLDELGISNGVIDGGTDTKTRRKLQKDFQAGQLRVLVLQAEAGSESLNLTKAAYSFLLEHHFNPLVFVQFKGRTRRVGQTRKTFHTDLAFGAYQKRRLRIIRDVAEFGRTTMTELEATVEYQRFEEYYNQVAKGIT